MVLLTKTWRQEGHPVLIWKHLQVDFFHKVYHSNIKIYLSYAQLPSRISYDLVPLFSLKNKFMQSLLTVVWKRLRSTRLINGITQSFRVGRSAIHVFQQQRSLCPWLKSLFAHLHGCQGSQQVCDFMEPFQGYYDSTIINEKCHLKSRLSV